MDTQKLAFSIAVVMLGLACFVVGTVAVTIPHWGTFRNRVFDERGNFGPWTMCKDMGFGRQMCGANISMFRPMFVVYAAGICAAIAVGALGFYCLTALLYISLHMSKSHSSPNHKRIVLIIKLLFSVIAALLTITAVGLFAAQSNDLENGYVVQVTFSFYMEVVLSVFTFVLMLLTIGEYYSSRSSFHEDYNAPLGFSTTIGNPGYREEGANGRSRGNGISMTDSSVHFVPSGSNLVGARRTPPKGGGSRHSKRNGNKYKDNSNHWNNGSVTSMSPGSNGSSSIISSMSTISTVASVSSTPIRAPLRSSLKKSKTAESPLGIQNPGFTGTSPTLSRTGSLKKVRIQTTSTDV